MSSRYSRVATDLVVLYAILWVLSKILSSPLTPDIFTTSLAITALLNSYREQP